MNADRKADLEFPGVLIRAARSISFARPISCRYRAPSCGTRLSNRDVSYRRSSAFIGGSKSMKTEFETIVIGCGGIGSGALYWLSREIGGEVLGLEQFAIGHSNGS